MRFLLGSNVNRAFSALKESPAMPLSLSLISAPFIPASDGTEAERFAALLSRFRCTGAPRAGDVRPASDDSASANVLLQSSSRASKLRSGMIGEDL